MEFWLDILDISYFYQSFSVGSWKNMRSGRRMQSAYKKGKKETFWRVPSFALITLLYSNGSRSDSWSELWIGPVIEFEDDSTVFIIAHIFQSIFKTSSSCKTKLLMHFLGFSTKRMYEATKINNIRFWGHHLICDLNQGSILSKLYDRNGILISRLHSLMPDILNRLSLLLRAWI